jgi:hypothetical protein
VNRSSISLAIGLTAMLALAACGRFTGLPNVRGQPPTPVLTLEPSSGPVPLHVIADSSASHDDGVIVKREIAVGDAHFEEVGEHHSLSLYTSGRHRITLRVTDDSGRSASVEGSVTAQPDDWSGSDFRIDVHYPGGRMGPGAREVFEAAARRWAEVVVGDLRDTLVQAFQVERACDYGFSGMIDDILLFADLENIDGPGGIVGMAGACLLRTDGFPLAGVIILDEADVNVMAASGDLPIIVLHEMGHVLDLSQGGWQRRGLLSHERSRCYDSSLVRFTGDSAAEEFARLGGAGRVPVEENGVIGTACSHWNEETFRSELMTGYLDRDAALSRITAGALVDMGYQVSLDGADGYTLPSAAALRTQAAGTPVRERLLPPGGVIDEDGEMRPLPYSEPLDVELELEHPGSHDH